MPKDPKDYEKNKAYYLAREASKEGKKNRAIRQKDRRDAISDGRLTGKADPRVIDHKKALSKGGSGGRANTRIISAKANQEKYDH